MKNAIFWDVTPCGSCRNQCFGSMLQLLVTDNILFTLMMEAIRSSEISVLIRAAGCYIPKDGIHQRYLCLSACVYILCAYTCTVKGI
jgi:hypothetical protein